MQSLWVRFSKMTEAEVREAVKNSFWVTAKEALKLGFVDEILGDKNE